MDKCVRMFKIYFTLVVMNWDGASLLTRSVPAVPNKRFNWKKTKGSLLVRIYSHAQLEQSMDSLGDQRECHPYFKKASVLTT